MSRTGLDGYSSLKPFPARRRHSVEGLYSMGLSSQGPVIEPMRVDFMTVAAHSANRYLDRPAPSSLADVIDTILDKGLVIDIYVRVSLVGIELLTIDARIVIASVDTYLRFAEAVNRLDITEADQKPSVTDLAG